MFESLLIKTFYAVCVLSVVPLIASSIVGLVVAFFQAATQIQEASLMYLAKCVAVGVVVYASAGLVGREFVVFTQYTLSLIGWWGGVR